MLQRTALSQDRHAVAMLQPGSRLQVHSVFERALNLVDARGNLLTLLGPRGGNGPATVVLDAAPTEGLQQPWPESGQPARVDWGGHLTVGRWLNVRRTTVALWRPELTPMLAHPLQRRANLDVAIALAGRGGSDGLGGLLAHRAALLTEPPVAPPPDLPPLLMAAWSALVELLPVWRRGDAAAVGQAARGLIGLGPGQTPSGDDLLAGLIVASRRLDPADPRWDAFAAVLVAVARGRTSDLGFARLRYAAEGELDERSEQVINALLSGDPTTVERLTRHLLGYGHTSGLDTLVGLVLGIGVDSPTVCSN
jgi:Protein of unknown function (DUF2877)